MRFLAATTALALALAAAPAAGAALLTKEYKFNAGVQLDVGASAGDGLRLDAVYFQLPSTSGFKLFRSGANVTVEIAISNTGESSQKVGVAVALLDEEGRLLAVASGGTKLAAVKAGRQKIYKLIFDNVNGEAFRAATFKIAVESKP